MWHDPITQPPTPQLTVWLHRVPPDTPPFWGMLDLAVAQTFVCGPLNWPIPAHFIFRWKPIAGSSAPPGLPPIDKNGWRDPLFYPPPDLQKCWVRRLPFDTPPLRCTFALSTRSFVTDGETLSAEIPWFSVLRWRPRNQ